MLNLLRKLSKELRKCRRSQLLICLNILFISKVKLKYAYSLYCEIRFKCNKESFKQTKNNLISMYKTTIKLDAIQFYVFPGIENVSA